MVVGTGVQSAPFRLIGVDWTDAQKKSHSIREAVVTLINFTDQSLIDAVADPAERRRTFLIRSLVRLGDITDKGQMTSQLIGSLPAVDIETIENQIKALASGSGQDIASNSVLSDSFELKPGVSINGALVTTCQVRMLTLSDDLAIARLPEDERQAERVVRSVGSLGEVTDRTAIRDAIQSLVTPDYMRIFTAAARLLEKHTDAPEEAHVDLEYAIEGREILSEPFNLKVGAKVNGETVKSCRVRILQNRDWRAVAQKPKEDQGYWATVFGIYSFGELTDRARIQTFYDALMLPDTDLVTKEAGRLARTFHEETGYNPDEGNESGAGEESNQDAGETELVDGSAVGSDG